MAKRGKKQSDGVSDVFYQYFDRVEIRLMDIPKVYKDIEQALANASQGADLDVAMRALVQKWKVVSWHFFARHEQKNASTAHALARPSQSTKGGEP